MFEYYVHLPGETAENDGSTQDNQTLSGNIFRFLIPSSKAWFNHNHQNYMTITDRIQYEQHATEYDPTIL